MSFLDQDWKAREDGVLFKQVSEDRLQEQLNELNNDGQLRYFYPPLEIGEKNYSLYFFDHKEKKQRCIKTQLTGSSIEDFFLEQRLGVNNKVEIDLELERKEKENGKEWTTISPLQFPFELGFSAQLKMNSGIIEECFLDYGINQLNIRERIQNGHLLQGSYYCSWLNSQAPIQPSLLWTLTVEKFVGLEVSDRTKVSRMILLELGRIQGHLAALTKFFFIIEDYANFWLTQELFDKLKDIFELYHGKRVFSFYSHLGGVMKDFPSGWSIFCIKKLREIETDLTRLESVLQKNDRYLFERETSRINRADLYRFAVTGPNLRGSGLSFDLRRDCPYYFYDQVEFNVPLGVNGHSIDRFFVRVLELKESIGLVQQLLSNMPTDRGDFFTLNQLNEAIKNRPIGKQVHQAIETANGELAMVLTRVDSDQLIDLQLVKPSLAHLNLLKKMAPGMGIEDFYSVMGSLDIVAGELSQ